MNNALKLLALSDDFSVIRAFEHFHDYLLDHVVQTRSELLEAVPTELRMIAGVDLLDSLDKNAHEKLSRGDSIRLARQLLTAFSESSGFEAVVVQSLEQWKDDRQLVDVILAIGVVGAVWICLASTEFEIKGARGTIRKETVSTEQLKAIAELIRATFRLKD
jgi:hypothetical protein